MNWYFKKIDSTGYVFQWKSKGLSDETVKPPSTSHDSLAPALRHYGTKAKVKFDGSCFKQDKITFTHGKLVYIYIIYEIIVLSLTTMIPHQETLCLVQLDYLKMVIVISTNILVMVLDLKDEELFHFPMGDFVVIWIFGVNISSSVHTDNMRKDILILGDGSTQGLDGTRLTAEKMYSINFNVTEKSFSLTWHYNGANSYLCVNGTEIHKLKAKDSEIVATSLCLGNITKDWPVDNMKKSWI